MIKNIIFDFDGVILDSVPTKTEAFKKLFEGFPSEPINQLLQFHQQNGGISRYIKIKYFFEEILNQPISKEEILKYADQYSKLTKNELTDPKYLIRDTVDFIKSNHQKYNMHIASGADENDLKHICSQLDLSKYFESIDGSPKNKNEIVHNIIEKNNYNKAETILVGDSINDYEASISNDIKFFGYNNYYLRENSNIQYLNSFNEFLG